jgi:integrase/recombinase XerD
MLNLYRRHQPPCRYRSRRYRTCNCPIWVQGSLRGEYIRRGLNLRSWSAATDLARDWEAAGEIGVVKKPDIPTVAEAVELFLQDARAQQLSPETIRKYVNLLNRRFAPWCESKGYRYLRQLGVEQMRQFRATWSDSANYANKNLERLRAFFRFCLQDDWIAKNPARAVKAPRVADNPTLPFTDSEMESILDACDRYPGNRDRVRAFVLVMRYSGLRIGDTIALDQSRLSDNKLLLYTAKTGTPVHVPLPPVVTTALAKLETNANGRFFSTGDDQLAVVRRKTRQRPVVPLDRFLSNRPLQRRLSPIRHDVLKWYWRRQPRRPPDLIANAVHHRLSQVGVEGAFPSVLESLYMPKRSEQRILNKVVGFGEVSGPAGKPSARPALERRDVARE